MSTPRRISHYELVASIGRDGLTEIYRARDLRLERDVAVKILRPEEMDRPDALERFRREARIASLVTHPHICAVHDSGEEAGTAFLVCELLEGRALDELIADSPVSAERLLDIGIQLADALVAAHRRGIVHGNLKPSNVFITSDGHVKLLELGAASAAIRGGSGTGTSLSGTTAVHVSLATQAAAGEFFHPYLSPEQIEGHKPDERSDIFATGALLYETATDQRAFSGDTTAQIAAAIAATEPVPPRTLKPKLPRAIERVIEKALAKKPQERYQTAAELYAALRSARRSLNNPEWRSSGWLTHRPMAIAGVAAAVAVLAAAGVAGSRWLGRPSAASAAPRQTMLVSHIANGTGDPDFDDTLQQAVTVYLSQSPTLELVSDDRIRSTLQLMGRPPEGRMNHATALELCERLGLQAMLEGSVSAVGRSTVIALVATDCGNRSTIARQQVEVDRKEDVLTALGQLTATIRGSLGESMTTLATHNVPIEDATTPSLDALKAYTEAVTRRAAGREMDAVPLLERAIKFDPEFALAYTTLSSVYGGVGETGRSEEYARLAYEHRARVSERERLFITYQYHDRFTGNQLKTREALEVWKSTYPLDYRAPNALAVLLIRLGDYTGAIAEAEEARRRNPDHVFPYSNLAQALRGSGRYAEARAVAGEAVGRNLETVPMRRLLYQIAELEGDTEARDRHLEWAKTRQRGFDLTGASAQVAAFRGRLDEARKLYAQTIDAAQAAGFSQVASGYAAQAALTAALYGHSRQAPDLARRTVRSATAHEPKLRAAAALALAGLPDEADAVLRRLRGVRPEDTLLQAAYFPVAEASVLLARSRFDGAIEQLRRASPYEFGVVAALAPSYLRGEARRRSGVLSDAIREFRATLEHRGADPFSPFIPLSQLALARALAADKQIAESRKAYEELLVLWKDADQGLPLFVQAREELDKLR